MANQLHASPWTIHGAQPAQQTDTVSGAVDRTEQQNGRADMITLLSAQHVGETLMAKPKKPRIMAKP